MRIADAMYVVGPLQCPHCGERKPNIESHGILRIRCNDAHCRRRWDAIRLPPGATGRQLIDMFGLPTARALLSTLVPDIPADDGTFSRTPIPAWDSRIAVYVQRAPDVLEEPMGWLRASAILASITGEG